MKFLAMHITSQKCSFYIFMVGNVLNIFMELNLNILMIFHLMFDLLRHYESETSRFCTDTVGTESIQTPLNFSLFVILQPFAKII